MTHEEYVEYSELLMLTWALILVCLIGLAYGVHGVLTTPPGAVETPGVSEFGIRAVQSGWLPSMMTVVMFSAILIESVKLRGRLEHHPGAATPGEDGVSGS